MNRAQLAMAYQACEVADLAATAVVVSDAAEALAQAVRVLAAAHQLVAAADLMAADSLATDALATDLAYPAKPTDPLQRFAYEHPEEAAADISEWLRSRGHDRRGHDCPEGAAAPAPD